MRTIRQILLASVCASAAWAQFSSGSTGADGNYNPTVSGDFDPVALGINAAGDNVFNFGTINIPLGVTIKLRASKLRNQAVTWLATGNVTIAGTLDLSGQPGATLVSDNPALLASTRGLPEPGPGGFPGGLGARGGVAPQAGAGPGGGPAGLQTAPQTCVGGNASFILPGYAGFITPGTTYGSFLLIPLYGGSGGGGGWDSIGSKVGGIGGAGAGALRIASSTQISVTGTINANGGNAGTVSGTQSGCSGGAGSGGAVHLVAPTITGNGAIFVTSGRDTLSGGTVINGITRFSTNTNSYSGTTQTLVTGPLYLPPANSTLTLPILSITQVNGVAVPAAPGGLYLLPDVVISANTPVAVNVAAKNIPLGTVVNLRLTSDTGADQNIACPGLAGTSGSSTATCTATFPFSVSIANIRANW